MIHHAQLIERESCPACRSNHYRTIYNCGFLEPPIRPYLEKYYGQQGHIELEYLSGARFMLDECQECGLVFQKYALNDAMMERLYEQWIAPQLAFQRRVLGNDLDYYSWGAQDVMKKIAYFRTLPSKLKFLDFGMGWGCWCRMAKAFGCECLGVELSKTRIEYAQSQGIEVVDWEEIPSHKFDLINAEQVFEHLREPLDTLLYLKQALKPQGLIAISVPNCRDIKRRLQASDWTVPKLSDLIACMTSKNCLHNVTPLEHINCFNRRSLITMASIARLKLVQVPLSIQYTYSTNWKLFIPLLKNLIRPLYRNAFRRSTNLLFRRDVD